MRSWRPSPSAGAHSTEPGGGPINLYLSIPLLIGTALVQSAWLARVDVLGARPDLMLLVVLIWTVVRGQEEGLVWGAIGGFVTDLISGGPLGIHILAYLAVALLAGQSWGQALGSSVLRLLLQAVLAGMAYHLVLLGGLSWVGRVVDWRYSVTQVLLPSVVLNAVLAPFARLPLGWLERRTRREGYLA